MARLRRPHMPGVVFHITARTQGRLPLFVTHEPVILSMIRDAVRRSDARVLAWAVMPNHLHLVLQQGSRPLARFMQPLLRRVAMFMQRKHGLEGHVFERRYRESACTTAEYMRNAIAYVHLNGLRAGLSTSADAYEWCSARSFCDLEQCAPLHRIALEDALRVFAARAGDTFDACIENYRRFLDWRVEMDAYTSVDREPHEFFPPSPPALEGGDDHWSRVYAPFVLSELERHSVRRHRLDLRDLAGAVMRELEPGMELEDLRCGSRTRPVVRVRRHVIRRALEAGYTGRAIAQFLSVSDATVSLARSRG